MTRKHKTYPKEGVQKQKDLIQDLKDKNRKLRKENKFLRDELKNIMKPVRVRKEHKDDASMTHEEWRKDFVRRFKEDLKERQEQAEKEEEHV